MDFDVIIIGGGPGGLSAGLYSSRSKLKTLILEKENIGGQMTITNIIENYPGAPKDSTGRSISSRMREQCESFGVEIKKETVIDLELDEKIKKVKTNKNEYTAKSIIISVGANPRRIGCKGEKEFTSRGVSYCATCDADFFTGLEVFVVGGGNSAVEEAEYLTKFARKVTLVHRREVFRATKIALNRLKNNPKVEFLLNTTVEEIKGKNFVNSIVLKNVKTGEISEHKADEKEGVMGIFPFIGLIPATDLLKDKLEMDSANHIIVNNDMKTSVDGVYAVGDCINKDVRQVITAASDGAIAAIKADHYIDENF